MITRSKYGWMYIDGKQKAILDSYLAEHNLPFPRFQGKRVPLEFAVFNEHGCYEISPEARMFLKKQEHNEAADVEQSYLEDESSTGSEED
jgi:hypothetical protein